MNRPNRTEVFFYAAFYIVFTIGSHFYCKEIVGKPLHKEPSYETQFILWGMYNPQGTNYSEVVKNLEVLPYFAVFCLFCLIINVSNVPHKTKILDAISIGTMISFYGVTLVVVIIGMIVAMATIGKCLRGIKVLPQIIGLMLLSFVERVLNKIQWLHLRQYLEQSTMAYAGFYAHVVRAMLICCDYASSQESVTWKCLFSECVGFPAFTNVFMPGSFVLFNDWKEWRDGLHEFVWTGPFQLSPKKLIGKATVVRKLSAASFTLRILRIALWIFLHKFFVCAVDVMRVMVPVVDRVLNDQGKLSDWGVISYVSLMIIMRFNVYYIIFYNISRLVGDLQQFLLSPAFNQNCDRLLDTNKSAMKAWRNASFLEKLFRVEIETECLMPEGPCWVLCVETSSEIWREFDIGLYNVLKFYIYIPWMETVTKLFVRGETKEKQKFSPLISNFSAICGALFTFLFVLTFHHWSKGNQIWVMFSFTLWFIERTVIQVNRSYGLSSYLEKCLSPAWERRIRCGICAVLQLLNMMSFYFFVTHFETGWFMMKTMLTHPCSQLLFLIAIYCTFNLNGVI